jgi:hypothetical protein
LGWKVLAYGLFVVKPGTRRLLYILRHRWEDNIKMDFKEIEWEGVEWIHMAEDWDRWHAVMSLVMNLWVP